MSGNPAFLEARRTQACDWVVRLQSADEAELLAFDAWLDASPENARAFDEALAVWTAFEDAGPEVYRELHDRRPRTLPTRRFLMAGGALAAAAAAAVVLLPQLSGPVPAATYATARGEVRTINLDDGSTIALNAGSRLTVSLNRRERSVRLDEGQAIFDVAADKSRPFVIAAGDRDVRVVGTRFDVRRRDRKLSVSVAEGLVEVRPAAGLEGSAFRLKPGQRLEHHEGEKVVRVSEVTPDEAVGWRTGRLVYRGQPLSDVIADLNAQYATQITIEDAALAATPITGVLILDDEAAVIRRLALLVSAEPVRSGTGVVLRR
jgi:transmembrane sensor